MKSEAQARAARGARASCASCVAARGDPRPLAVAGARELVPLLARELRAGGEASAVVEGRARGRRGARLGRRARRGAAARGDRAPACRSSRVTDDGRRAVRARRRPRPRAARARASRSTRSRARSRDALGEDGTALAARLPVLRGAVVRRADRARSRKRNALIAARGLRPGRRHAGPDAEPGRGSCCGSRSRYGQEIDRERALELLGVVGAGFGFRAVARELLDLVPVAGWAVKGAVAYAGTRAIGEAAVRYFEARAQIARSVRSRS